MTKTNGKQEEGWEVKQDDEAGCPHRGFGFLERSLVESGDRHRDAVGACQITLENTK